MNEDQPGCYKNIFIVVKRNKSKRYSYEEEEASKRVYFVPEAVKIFVESKVFIKFGKLLK